MCGNRTHYISIFPFLRTFRISYRLSHYRIKFVIVC
nr:MAG TPA: hypothetical protein [Caudoviricetes sp.]